MDLRFAICDLRLEETVPRFSRDRALAEPVSFSPAHKMREFAPQSQIANRKSQISFRPAFSFTEILFAVMILGIGFIMIAAMFPVAIKQTQATQEETIAAAIARSGADYLGRNATDRPKPMLPSDSTMPPTSLLPFPMPNDKVQPGSVVVAGYGFWGTSVGNMILPSDKRFAWVPFYRRDKGSSFAQVTVIGVQVRNRSSYDLNDYVQYPQAPPSQPPLPNSVANLQGKPVMVQLFDGGQSADMIQFFPVTGSPPPAPLAPPPAPPPLDYTNFVAEGCYVIIANDPGQLIPSAPIGTLTPVLHTANGYVYRVGLPRPDMAPNRWELMPGNDMKGTIGYKPTYLASPILAYIVGRGYTNPDPKNPDTMTPTGPAMDVAVYTTFVRVNTGQ
jgi:hypothetical protein